ncbi:unnamed protein product [Schistocephalus solidus]|uniref:Uncharacterized protein n=1 Tax=Schistocephalus solidus TaxID=70667 RepID=A0A183SYZ5_SCHSO|nr:unnamed protein product [Schistocephalus solidus]
MLGLTSSAAGRGSQTAIFFVLETLNNTNNNCTHNSPPPPKSNLRGIPSAVRASTLTLATLNGQSLLDNLRSNRPEWRTVLVAQELIPYKVKIAALSETRLSEQRQLEEMGAGYNFICCGRAKRRWYHLLNLERHRGTSTMSATGYQ